MFVYHPRLAFGGVTKRQLWPLRETHYPSREGVHKKTNKISFSDLSDFPIFFSILFTQSSYPLRAKNTFEFF